MLTSLLIISSSCSLLRNSNSTTSSTFNVVTTANQLSSDPQEALNQLADLDSALDQSRISETSCGKFALTVGPNGLRTYKWTDGYWKYERGAYENTFNNPYLITTRDYDDDGISEFLVNFNKGGVGSSNAMFGGILDVENCLWNWVTFITPNGSSTTIDRLTWSDTEEALSGAVEFDQSLAPLDYTKKRAPVFVFKDQDGYWIAKSFLDWLPTNFVSCSAVSNWDGSQLTFAHGEETLSNSGDLEKCFNGAWILVKSASTTTSTSISTSGSGHSSPPSTQTKDRTVDLRWCEIKAFGLTSSFYGQMYTWTIYNLWSDGSKSIYRSGAGYANQLPNECL